MKLTAATIRNLTLPAGKVEYVVTDERLQAFRLRIRAGGSKRLELRLPTSPDGRRPKHTFGPEALLNPERAVEEAKTILAKIRLGGATPRAERVEARRRAGETFGGKLVEYLALQRALLRPRSYEENRRHLEVVAEPLHPLPLRTITPAVVSELVSDVIAERGRTAAKHVAQSLNAFGRWCVEKGYTDTNFATLTRKERHALRSEARTRCLTENELQLILTALGTDRFSLIVHVLLRLGLRRNEVANLRWDEVILEDRFLKLPPARVKNGEERIVVLPRQVAAILSAQKRGSALVFGGYRAWDQAKRALDERIAALNGGASIEPWVLHDFRRSLATWCGDVAKIHPFVVEMLLGHKVGSKTALTYNHAKYLGDQTQAITAWNNYLDVLAGKRRGANVVDLKR